MANNLGDGILYVVATPIGNLEDMSVRCIDVLKTVDLVAAEDTRRTGNLLRGIGSSVRLESFHAHSSESKGRKILGVLTSGKSVALVTDAGTPGVSDPGADLVALAREAGVSVVPIPGPSAVTAALSASGFSADRYLFLGFLPRKGKLRKELLKSLADSVWTTVLYESPNRLVQTLQVLSGLLEEGRRVMVAREISKLYEDHRVGIPQELEGYYRKEPVRGEVTLVVEGGVGPTDQIDPTMVEDRARELLTEGATRKDIVTRLIDELGGARNEIYRIVTNL